MSRLSKTNANYKFILTSIDIWSRKAFCRLQKGKTAVETVASMRDIFDEAEIPPKTILFDRGKF